jgi:protein SCO1/2
MGLKRLLALAVAASTLSCSTPPAHTREFPLTGTIVAIKADRTEVTVKHDEVKGFMDAMTMPFAVREPSQASGLAVGDVIAATLVLTDEASYLTGIRRTRPAPSAPPGGSLAPPR